MCCCYMFVVCLHYIYFVNSEEKFIYRHMLYTITYLMTNFVTGLITHTSSISEI